MKRFLMAVGALAALVVPAAYVMGQDAFKEDIEKTLKVADVNKDGKITAEEAKSTYKEREDALDAAYKESKGKDAGERVDAIYKKYEGVISLRDFLRADADDDMTVTRDELAEYYARINTKHAKGPPKLSDKDFETLAADEIDQLWPKLIKFDADKDGKLSRDEIVKFAAADMKESEDRAAANEIEHIIEPPPIEKEPAKDGK